MRQKRSRRDGKKTQKNCTKKDLNDPANVDAVVFHSEPNIVEYKIKWALGSVLPIKSVEMMESQQNYLKS